MHGQELSPISLVDDGGGAKSLSLAFRDGWRKCGHLYSRPLSSGPKLGGPPPAPPAPPPPPPLSPHFPSSSRHRQRGAKWRGRRTVKMVGTRITTSVLLPTSFLTPQETDRQLTDLEDLPALTMLAQSVVKGCGNCGPRRAGSLSPSLCFVKCGESHMRQATPLRSLVFDNTRSLQFSLPFSSRQHCTIASGRKKELACQTDWIDFG